MDIKNFLKTKGINIIGILIVLYILFSLGRAVWKNWQIAKETKELKAEIQRLKDDNENLTNKIAYYQTPAFKELEARARLGYKKKGEEIMNLPKTELENQDINQNTITTAIQGNANQGNNRNYILWWQYFVQ